MKVYIWSKEHQGYWKPASYGYTPLKSEAGLYTLEEAVEICKCANFYVKNGEAPEEMVVPIGLGEPNAL